MNMSSQAKPIPAKMPRLKTASKEPSKPSIASDAGEIELYGEAVEYFSDGVSDFLLGNQISKITYYTKTGPKKRRRVVTVTLSTLNLVRMCKNVLASAKRAEDDINLANIKRQESLSKLLIDVPDSKESDPLVD
jgi:hypothetical protein